ncbi:MAG: deoxynucleoside kinase [Acidobacteriota bacterium]|nr:deoxynucleoside kinase [Acidobacteriota bacterium]
MIAIEGPNGSGKTTLCGRLAQVLHAPRCLGTDEAWCAEPFKSRMIREAEWHASALFFLSGCLEQMRLLRARPESVTVMDRSLWSTLAVHGAESAERLQTLLQVLEPLASQVRVPDLTLVLEASFTVCQSRIARKSGISRALDQLTATPDFHACEQAFYQWLGEQRPEVLFLDVSNVGADEAARQAMVLLSGKI